MSDAPAIEIRDLGFSYGDLPVLEDIDLSVARGEFFGLIGPNAAGKSTLLRLMLGLEQPDRGSIRVLGRDPAAARPRIGYVPQHPGYSRRFPVTVEDVVVMGRLGVSSARGGYSRRDRELAREAMRLVAIEAIARRSIGGLSGGQVQRMLIARALVCDPELLILDEPTANIDLQGEETIYSILRQHDDRMTIVVVSHDVAFISGYVDRVGCLNRRLVCHSTKEISGLTIEQLYGGNVSMIEHHH